LVGRDEAGVGLVACFRATASSVVSGAVTIWNVRPVPSRSDDSTSNRKRASREMATSLVSSQLLSRPESVIVLISSRL
jgi:hypothetical protein